MNAAALALEGTRVLLQGTGVGVRAGHASGMFDRDAEAAPAGRRQHSAAGIFEAAARWLRDRGFTPPERFTGAPLAAAAGDALLDHVAFAVDDLSQARSWLQSTGAVPIRDAAHAVVYRTVEGATVELVERTDREDAFWCPMHLDVRSGTLGRCPLCGMDLVPIPPPAIGEYRMDVALMPAARGQGLSGLRLRVRAPETHAPVSSLVTVHERPMHLFIVSRALDYFAHVHPEPAAGETFELRQDLRPGEYMLIADFMPVGGTPQTVLKAIVTPGYEAPLAVRAPVLPPQPHDHVVDGIRIRMTTSAVAPRAHASLQFTLTDASTGALVTGLEPFLGAPAHMLLVKSDLTDAMHGHPEGQGLAASTITFEPLIPAPGTYKLWVQFQRNGRVITAPFVLIVDD